MGNAFDVIIRAGKRVFVFGLFVLSLMGCSALLQHAKTRTPNPAATVASTNTTYQISLEKNFGRGIVESVAWAPDGNSFALATSTEVDMYDAQTLEIVATLDTNKQWNKELAYSPNGRLLAVGGEKGTIQIWDPNSRKLIFTLRPIGSQPGYNTESEFSFSADGQQLVSGFNQSLSLWDLKTGTLVDSFPGYLNGVNQVAISPDGKVVLAAGGRTVSVRTVSSRELLYPPVSVKDDIVSVIMLPDGKQFVTISSEFLFVNNTTDVHYVSRIRTLDFLSGKLQNEQVLKQSRVESVAVNLKHHLLVLGP